MFIEVICFYDLCLFIENITRIFGAAYGLLTLPLFEFAWLFLV